MNEVLMVIEQSENSNVMNILVANEDQVRTGLALVGVFYPFTNKNS